MATFPDFISSVFSSFRYKERDAVHDASTKEPHDILGESKSEKAWVKKRQTCSIFPPLSFLFFLIFFSETLCRRVRMKLTANEKKNIDEPKVFLASRACAPHLRCRIPSRRSRQTAGKGKKRRRRRKKR